MPEPNGKQGLLNSIFGNIPSVNTGDGSWTPEMESEAQRASASRPLWKQYFDTGLDTMVGGVKGLLGLDVDPNGSMGSKVGNFTGQLAQSGLPFSKILGGNSIFHGSKSAFDKFKPELNDESDVLGWMTHLAEDPKYAEQYAVGSAKHGGASSYDRPNIIAAKPEAQNTLDLVDPNPDDMSAALAGLDPIQRQYAIKNFKGYRSSVRNDTSARDILTDERHYPDVSNIPRNELAVRALAEYIRLDPNSFAKTPFDAIRYNDMGHKSWAIPADTPIRSAYGAPLTNTSEDLKVLRNAGPMTGVSKVADDRWAHTPLNLPEVPHTEAHKLNPDELMTDYKTQDMLSKAYYTKKKAKANADVNEAISSMNLEKVPTSKSKIQESIFSTNSKTFQNMYNKENSSVNNETVKHLPGFGYMTKSEAKNLVDTGKLHPDDFEYKFGKPKIEEEESDFHPIFGQLSKKEASDLVSGGELPMSWYMNHFK